MWIDDSGAVFIADLQYKSFDSFLTRPFYSLP